MFVADKEAALNQGLQGCMLLGRRNMFIQTVTFTPEIEKTSGGKDGGAGGHGGGGGGPRGGGREGPGGGGGDTQQTGSGRSARVISLHTHQACRPTYHTSHAA